MYEFYGRGLVTLSDDERRAAVSHHRGSSLDFIHRHKKDADHAVRAGLRGLQGLAPYLFNRITDARTLRLAWDFLALKGGQAPGRNGHRYRDYTSAEVWDLCRCLASAIHGGTYQPGPERVIYIDKTSGKGQRPIVLLNIEDRVVQRAVVCILQPVLDPLFDSRSFGYRRGFGHLHALAHAEHLTLSERRRTWLIEDIKDAFQHVPLNRLLQTIEKVLPNRELLNFLDRLLPGQELPGLRQGGSLSPLMLNWYLHYFLDRPWRRDCPQTPLIRVADDLLAVCRSKKKALGARAHLECLLTPAGMPLKGTPDTSVHDLAGGKTADWLGFAVRKAERVLAFGIGRRSWNRLDEYLARAHAKDHSSLRAFDLVKQWLSHRGPCYAGSNREEVCKKILALAHEHAFEEVPGPDDLMRGWRTAYARWCKLRSSVRGALRPTAATQQQDRESSPAKRVLAPKMASGQRRRAGRRVQLS